MKIAKYILVIISLILISPNLKSQINLELQLGQGQVNVLSPTDTLYTAFLKISITDSISNFSSKIRVVVKGNDSIFQDNTFIISEIPTEANENNWKLVNDFFFHIPLYNPNYRRVYFVELLSANEMLLKQLEIEL